MSRYDHYKTLTIRSHPEGVIEVVMGGPGKLATDRKSTL